MSRGSGGAKDRGGGNRFARSSFATPVCVLGDSVARARQHAAREKIPGAARMMFPLARRYAPANWSSRGVTTTSFRPEVIGFMSLENGLILAAVGVRGMPFVVEMSVAFSVMVAFIIFGVFFFHIRERFDTLDLHYLETFRGERE